MGGIASVHVRPSAEEASSQSDRLVGAEEGGSQADLDTIQQNWPCDGGTQPNLLEVRVTSALPAEGREAEMGRIIQYLAEENVILRRRNNELDASTESSQIAVTVIQPDIYGETNEEKIERLEKTLAIERAEKWDSIEHSEKCRVDLVNCKFKLDEAVQTKEKLLDELKLSKRQISDLCELERLKSISPSENEAIKKSERSQEETDNSTVCDRFDSEAMAAFRTQLQEKREQRQKAIAAKSLEINQIRDDLKRERILREKLERELHRIKKCRNPNEAGGSEPKENMSDLQLEKETLLDEVSELKQSILATNTIKEENQKLIDDIQNLNREIRHLNTMVLQRDNDLKEFSRKYNRVLRDQNDLQKENERRKDRQKEMEEEQQKIWEEYDREKEQITKRTLALKDIIAISRQMLVIREKQVTDLKQKLKEIEDSLSEKQRLEDSVLKVEYEKQLENIKLLKTLYEERLNLLEAEKKKLTDKISDDAQNMDTLKSELSDLTIKYDMAADELDTEKQSNISLSKELDGWIAQARSYERELSVMNNLITQMLVGPHGSDLDRLTEQLQQNHALIAEMTTCEDCSDVASTLPKMLLGLITQVEEADDKDTCGRLPTVIRDPMTDSTDTISEQSEGLLADNDGAVLPIVSYRNATVFKPPVSPTLLTEKEESSVLNEDQIETHAEKLEPAGTSRIVDPAVQVIMSNLPKVWKVLTELLSHHSTPEGPPIGDERNCYKSIDTPNGPRSVISVSNTFLRLKDLILEKKYLQKEVYRLKHLNSHLETRLDDQEKRLSTVRCELHKTWGVVGRMRAQHQQLHNQEKILRYELQEKRVMLTELKQELEYCRDKWDRARRKNNESEIEWRKLRKEFAARKLADAGLPDSGESGYSDEQNDSDDAARSTPSPVDFVNAAHVLETVSHQPISCIDVVITDEEVIIAYDIDPPLLERTEHCVESATGEPEKTEEETPLSAYEATEPVLTEEGATALTDHLVELGCQNVNIQGAAAKIDLLSDEDKERARNERANRLQRLEDQCQLLVRKMDVTTHKSNFLSDRLDELHEQYGGNTEENKPMASTSASCAQGILKDNREITTTTDNFIAGDVDGRSNGSTSINSTSISRKSSLEGEVNCTEQDIAHEDTTRELTEKLNGCDDTKSQSHANCGLSMDQLPDSTATNSTVESNASSCTISPKQEVMVVQECLNTPQSENVAQPERDTSLATFDERMAARAAKLKRLEEQCSSLFGKVSNTVQRGTDMTARLEEIHNSYANAEARAIPSRSSSSEVTNQNNNQDESIGDDNVIEPIDKTSDDETDISKN